jgi:parvulin-like peptidyl-prolyl isomerase
LAKNKKAIKPKREMSRGQLANWQKQERRQRLILNIAILVVVAVFLVVGVGWFFTNFQPQHQKVLVVNGTVVRMDYYVDALKYFSGDSASSVSQTEPSLVTYIEEREFVREGARQLGISVADNETEAALKNRDLPAKYSDFVNTELMAQKVYEYFQSQVPSNAEYRHLKAALVDSESQAQSLLSSFATSGNFSELALLSEDSYTKQQSGDLGFQMKDILALPSYLGTDVVGDFAFSAPADNTTIQIVKDATKVKNVGYWLLKVTDREFPAADNQTAGVSSDNQTISATSDNQTPSRVRISAILLASEDEATSVKARLDAGEDFVTLVKELSQDKTSRDQDGDLGWFTPGTIRPAFESFALDPATPLNTASDVTKDTATVTTGGYWLIQVLGIDANREVATGDRDLLANTAFNDWLTALRTNPENKIDILITEKQHAWAVDTATKELGG